MSCVPIGRKLAAGRFSSRIRLAELEMKLTNQNQSRDRENAAIESMSDQQHVRRIIR